MDETSVLTTLQQNNENPLVYKYVIGFATLFIIVWVIYRLSRAIEFYLVSKNKKPLYNHFYFRLKKLSDNQYSILKNDYSFFKKLTPKQQQFFQHRVASFIKNTEFIGKENLVVTDQMKVIIAATATMLTFGFRKYRIKILDKILIYPKAFHSKMNDAYHKGEFNPAYNAIVFSWEDVLHGYSIDNDNFNVVIHEFVHALHLDCIKEKGLKAAIFLNTFIELANFLERRPEVKAQLIESKYFREYAYTNQFEFLSVIIENFIETPNDFRGQFPKLYNKVKQMLNFDFAGY